MTFVKCSIQNNDKKFTNWGLFNTHVYSRNILCLSDKCTTMSRKYRESKIEQNIVEFQANLIHFLQKMTHLKLHTCANAWATLSGTPGKLMTFSSFVYETPLGWLFLRFRVKFIYQYRVVRNYPFYEGSIP